MRHLFARWTKNAANGEYLDLLRLNLHDRYFYPPRYAVYVIWYTAPIKYPGTTASEQFLDDCMLFVEQFVEGREQEKSKTSGAILEP